MVTGLVAMLIGTTDEMAVGVETTIVKDGRRRLDEKTIAPGKTRTAAGTGATLMDRTASALGLPNPTDDKAKTRTDAEAPVRMAAAVRKAIIWTSLAAMAMTCQMFKSCCCKMCTRTLSTGYSEPFGSAS